MAKLLLFESNNSEYVVIDSEDLLNPEEEHGKKGYEIKASVDIYGDIDLFPTDRELRERV